MIEVTTATAPSYWASYLVNGDAEGLTPEEKARADHWLAQQASWHVVSTIEGSERFTWHYSLYDTLARDTGGEVLDYVMRKSSE